jgi:hypothetical protein
MQSVPELIDAFGGPTSFSQVIGKRPSTASEMKRNRSIPVDYWPKVIAVAAERGIDGVTAEMLMRIHAGEAPTAPANDSEQTTQETAMSEVTDIIVPILQRMQADLGDLKRKADVLTERMDGLTERMDAFEDYFTYTMGLTQQNKADMGRIRKEITAIKARLNGPEGQR